MRKILKSEKGTTLVEALVAVLILSIGLIPSLAIILLATNFSSAIKNNLIAANLAQEGVEIVRALRDDNWFNDRAFDYGIVPGTGTYTYTVDWNSTALMPEGTNPPLKIDSNGLYNYTNGSGTGFRRRLIITKDPAVACGCQLKVIAEVKWPERNKIEIINVESYLYDWK